MTAGTVVVLALQGRLTSVLHPGASAVELLTRVQAAKPRIILNLGAVAIVDCSGVGLIAAACRAARDRGGDLRLLGLHERPRRLLELCGVLRVIQTFKTEENALASFVGRDDPELYLERAPVFSSRQVLGRMTV
jgi:anti-sigma B factor antagonist